MEGVMTLLGMQDMSFLLLLLLGYFISDLIIIIFMMSDILDVDRKWTAVLRTSITIAL